VLFGGNTANAPDKLMAGGVANLDAAEFIAR
jgi:hypothetical protein